jgi:methylmalonyl-CoA mutase N-terminal domain/subunit
MPKLEDSVNEILGLEGNNKVVPENLEPQKGFQPPVPRKNGEVPLKVEKDINTDYDYSRESYYSIIEKGQEAIQGILDIAKEGQHPRAYEVVGQLIGQVGTTVDKLQDLQKKFKDLKELPGRTNANIKNALFVGSTAELQKMLNKQTMETKMEKKNENETIDGKSKDTE